MSKPISDEELFQKLADQLGVEVTQINEDFQKLIEEVKRDERFTTADENTIKQIAKNRLIARKRREMASPAITWEGIILGVGDLIDGVMRQRQLTEQAFKVDPFKTQEGWMFGGRLVLSDADGKPLYPKTESNTKWGRTGKPLPDHSWMRNIFGVASPIDKKTRKAGEPRPFTMILSDKRAINGKAILMNVPIRFRGIDKTTAEHQKAGVYNITDSAFTEFQKAPDLKLPTIETIISTNCSKLFEPLGALDEYHSKTQNDPGRWLITEGTVSLIDMTPNPKTQNLRMVVDDETLLFTKGEGQGPIGVTCWVPTDRNIIIDFAQDSRIYILGKTTQGKKLDPVTRQPTDEPGDIMLNVYGIYCPEMFKVKVIPQEVPPTALEPTAEPKEEW
jgi:hypothetical protein